MPESSLQKKKCQSEKITILQTDFKNKNKFYKPL